MKIRITFALFFLFVGLYAQHADENVSLKLDEGSVEGTLLYPKAVQKIPVVLLISGSGPTDRDGNNTMMQNNSLKMVAEALAENGIASLRFDKRGIAASRSAAEDESKMNFNHLVGDVKSWIDTLSLDKRFDEIIVMGHSEGSTMGMIASQKDEVAKYISLAGPGSKAADILKEQLGKQAPAWLEDARPILDSLEAGHIVTEVPAHLQSIFRPSVMPYLISWFKYDPQVEIAKLNKPILIVQGTTDIQVSVAEAEKLHTANSSAKLLVIENMNHVLKEVGDDMTRNIQTYSEPELPLRVGLIEDLVEFIKSK